MNHTRSDMIEMIGACWVTQVCGAAAGLGIADACGTEERMASDIARETGYDAGMVKRLLRAMCSLGLAEQIDAEHFRLTAKGDLLRSDADGSLKGLATAWTSHLWAAWSGLADAVRSGRPVVANAFAEASLDPVMAATLNQSQADRSRAVAEEAARLVNLSGCRTVTDLGGGYGTVLAALLRANPSLNGRLADLAYLEPEARRFLDREGVTERAMFSAIDFFREAPPAADAYVLKSILHDWPDEDCATILGNVARAARPGTRLLVIEQILPDLATAQAAGRSAFRTDLTMMVGTTGRERTTAEFNGLLARAGFRLDAIRPTATEFYLIEASWPPV
jgi:hypothetical protein